MISIKRTNSDNSDFQELVKDLDLELKIRDGEEHVFDAQLNKTDRLQHAVVAYDQGEAVGCGAVREYSEGIMEVKRMFIPLNKRGHGIATAILAALEMWCRELNVTKSMLETGKNQPQAIGLYLKNNYKMIPNFGKYVNSENSICFEKDLINC